MLSIEVSNVNSAFFAGMHIINDMGIPNPSRFGDVLEIPTPVTTLYHRPRERVLFHPLRDANPFFHFMEGLWMIGGRRDVNWISQFSSGIAQFSDDGRVFHGAYGHRWREHFGMDQMLVIAELMKKNMKDRRIVMQMWDPRTDLANDGKDFPCNTQIMFRVVSQEEPLLDMTVINRSNDMIWGAYGANAVHMSMMQEVMAALIGIPAGRYWQISNNFHAYANVFDKYVGVLEEEEVQDPYGETVVPYPMVDDPKVWLEELDIFLKDGPIVGFRERFFRRVAVPMYVGWKAWKQFKETGNTRDYDMALSNIQNCSASDWKLACQDWLERRAPA